MKQYRIRQLEGCSVWRVEHLAQPRWPFRWWVAPQWRPVYEYSMLAIESPARPVERDTYIGAVEVVGIYEQQERERLARKSKSWRTVP